MCAIGGSSALRTPNDDDDEVFDDGAGLIIKKL
jgi:hypothetical protein